MERRRGERGRKRRTKGNRDATREGTWAHERKQEGGPKGTRGNTGEGLKEHYGVAEEGLQMPCRNITDAL